MRVSNHGLIVSLRLWLGVLALACVSLSASARDLNRYSDLNWNTNGNTAQGVPATGTGPGPDKFKAASGGATASGKKALPWPGKSQAENMARWKALASPRNMAKGMLGGGLGGPITLLGGMLMKQLVDEACVRVFGGVLVDNGVWEECNMKSDAITEFRILEPTGTNFTGSVNYVNSWVGSRQASCDLVKEAYDRQCLISFPGGCPQTYTGTLTGVTNSTDGTCRITNTNGTQQYNRGFENRAGTGAPYQDPVTPYIPATEQRVEDQVTDKLTTWCQSDFTAGLAENTGKCAGTLAEMLHEQIVIVAMDEGLTGPASYTGPSVLNVVQAFKTFPDGTTATVTVTTSTQDTFKYGYVDDTVTTTKTTGTTETTTVEPGPGSTLSPTTTSTSTVSTTTVADPSEDTSKTDCERNPNTLGCAELDTPETPVPKSTANVEFSVDNLGLGEGTCPAPITFSTSAGQHTISYQAACDFTTSILKPLLLAIAAMMAYFIVAGGVGREV